MEPLVIGYAFFSTIHRWLSHLPPQLSSILPPFSWTGGVQNICCFKDFIIKNFWSEISFENTAHCYQPPLRFIAHYTSLNISCLSPNPECLKTIGAWDTVCLVYLLKSCRTVFLQTTVGGKLREAMSTGANTSFLQHLFSLLLPLSGLGISGLQSASITSCTSAIFVQKIKSSSQLQNVCLCRSHFNSSNSIKLPLEYFHLNVSPLYLIQVAKTEIIHLFLLPESPFLSLASLFFCSPW